MNSKRTWMMAPRLAAVLLLISARASADSLAPGDPAQSFTIADFATQLGAVTDFRFLPDGRMVIVSLDGTVRIRQTDGTVAIAGQLTNIVSGDTQGLLGMEVDPDYVNNHRLFFYYTASTSSGPQGNRVSSFTVDTTLNLVSEQILVGGIPSPGVHNGGGLALGLDGTLFVGSGDTGCETGFPPDAGLLPSNFFPTCLASPNGKILRITLDGGIPLDDPLVDAGAVESCGPLCGSSPSGTAAPLTDIWAWGFRNPFRMSVDRLTGNLWVGDVGDVTYEEINLVQSGHHYGAPWREGAAGWDAGICDISTPDAGRCVDPVYFCRHDDGGIRSVDGNCASVTGGLFVDSCSWPAAYQGRYFFGDAVTGSVFMLQMDSSRTVTLVPTDGGSPRSLFASISDGGPVSFQLGPDNNLYAAVLSPDLQDGRIVQITPIVSSSCDGGSDAGSKDGGGGTRPGPVNNGSGTPTPLGCGCSAVDGAAVAVGLGLMASMLLARPRKRRE